MIEQLDYTNALWADGPALLSWLESIGVKLRYNDPALRRKIERWADDGRQASFWDVDRVLIAASLHPSQVPDSIWCHYRNGRKKNLVTHDGEERTRTPSQPKRRPRGAVS